MVDVETHIDRLSEDLEAFGKIMDRAPYFELNADLVRAGTVCLGLVTGTL